MMYKNILLLTTLIAGLLLVSSCGGDADCEDAGVFDEFNMLQDEVNSLGVQLATDPTVCNDLRSLTEDLIDEANDVLECVDPSQLDQFMSNISVAEANLANLNCG